MLRHLSPWRKVTEFAFRSALLSFHLHIELDDLLGRVVAAVGIPEDVPHIAGYVLPAE
jgi:hypothetical protein